MKTALFLNGIYEKVIEDILASQELRSGGTHYIQPYKGSVIQMLKKKPPSPDAPVAVYFSTTKHLNNICYTGEIVGWRDKRTLTNEERQEILDQITEHQPGEKALFTAEEEVGKKAVNLLTLRNVRPCQSLLPTSVLKKRSDAKNLKARTRSGSWSEVEDAGDIFLLPAESRQNYESDLIQAVSQSSNTSDADRIKRLSSAKAIPDRVQIVSTGFRRNPDVIVEVLKRAAGVCEKCNKPAPFVRKSDGSPFLEVHHWIPLAEHGPDTVDNAGALCPNCHREAHYG